MKGRPGGVTVLAINAGDSAAVLMLSSAAERFMLTADTLQSRSVLLNGSILEVTSDGRLPQLKARSQSAGTMSVPARSMTFITFPNAGNPSCR
jgi:hypothetical protein